MHRTIFNRIIVILMLMAVALLGIVAIVDFLPPTDLFIGHIMGYFSLMAIPFFWELVIYSLLFSIEQTEA